MAAEREWEGLLIVDDRENKKIIHKLIMRLGDAKTDPDGKVLVARLKSGDYIIGDWIIEAKEINDLAGSILGKGRSRTVAAQLRRMVEVADNNEQIPYLTVYNTKLKPFFRKGKRGGKRNAKLQILRMESTIRAFKLSFCCRFPSVRYFQLESMDDFIEWIIESYKQKVLLS